jgi:hypothetical protein
MGTDFEQRLFRTLAQPIYDPATGRVAQRFENAVEFIVVHAIAYAIKLLHVKAPSIVVCLECEHQTFWESTGSSEADRGDKNSPRPDHIELFVQFHATRP